MYLEGTDQYRGWFQSSLLVAVGTRDRAPYRESLTHGFIVDEQGRKMSKSLGNTIVPQQVMKDSGADVLRLWVSMVDYRDELRLGKSVLARTIEAYRKIRNTFRYLLANLYDFDPARDAVPAARLLEVDRFALALYAQVAEESVRAYQAYEFQRIFQAINELVTVDLSAFYVDVSKDRLYTLAPGSPSRRSAQTALYLIADGLSRMIAPILPVTAEQLWKVLPAVSGREESVHLAEFPTVESLDRLSDPGQAADWQRLLAIRDAVNAAIEEQRQKKMIGNSLMMTSRMPTRLAASTFSLMPPTGSTRPDSVISPVIAISPRTGRRVSSDARAVTIVTPADGPSFGIAPDGTCRWISAFL